MGIGIVKKAIFLDRDGVLNAAVIRQGKPFPPASVEEVIIPNEVLPALIQLKNRGFLLIGITNQPDVARGMTTREKVEEINLFLMQRLPLLEIKVCYHDDAQKCNCRKPLPGLLLQAAQEYQIDLTKSVMIGDRWKDIAAGQSAGCQTIWLQQDYAEKKPEQPPNAIVPTLSEAAEWISSSLPPPEEGMLTKEFQE